MMLFIWLIIGICIYYFIKNNELTNIKNSKATNAEELLKHRYVNGEIDEENYKKMIKVISE